LGVEDKINKRVIVIIKVIRRRGIGLQRERENCLGNFVKEREIWGFSLALGVVFD